MGTGYGPGYPKWFYRYFKGFKLLEKVAQSFIHYLQKHLFSLQCHDSESVYGVKSVP